MSALLASLPHPVAPPAHAPIPVTPPQAPRVRRGEHVVEDDARPSRRERAGHVVVVATSSTVGALVGVLALGGLVVR
jgi:hypothetical protein